jgi:hypothetical protein
MHHCKACDRKLPFDRLFPYQLWGETVCRACYYWAREVIYGDMTGNHALTTPWPHGTQEAPHET